MADVKISIVDKLDAAVNAQNPSKVANNFKYYRDRLKNKGLLREDSYDWPNDNSIGKSSRESPMKQSKNEILHSSIQHS
jgi:hypothetical protein